MSLQLIISRLTTVDSSARMIRTMTDAASTTAQKNTEEAGGTILIAMLVVGTVG